MRVKPAFGIKEFRKILKGIAEKLEDNFLFSMDLKYRSHLKNNYPLEDKLIEQFNNNDFSLEPPALVIRIKEKWIIKTGGKKYKLKSDGKRLNVYLVGKKPILNLSDIKGIIISEVIKRDPCMIFESRDGLKVTLNNIKKWDNEMGERKACHKKEKRIKRYKKRLDKWWKQAKKKQRKDKVSKKLQSVKNIFK